jgi:hypothetical protein
MMMNENSVVDAIRDLGRIMIALSDRIESKADAIRRLDAMSIPPSRIASFLSIKLNDVTSVIHRERKRSNSQKKGRG